MSSGLRLIGMMPGCGYGDAACEYAAALDNLGVPVSWTPAGSHRAGSLRQEQTLAVATLALADQLSRLWHSAVPCDRFLLSWPPIAQHWHWLEELSQMTPYCYVAWEVEQVPEGWCEGLNRYERVLVPSRFNRDAFLEAGVTTDIELLPHISRLPNPLPQVPALGTVREDDFVFYSIGAWTTRKAMLQNISAFLDAFSGDDPVALVVKTEPLDRTVYESLSKLEKEELPDEVGTSWWALAKILGKYANPGRIHLIAEELSGAEIDGLHLRGDCYLSLTHSEGWGLGAFDAARTGNPVIMTGWGGQLDYLGEDYPSLVDYELKPTSQYPDDGYFMRADNVLWAQADSAHASMLMQDMLAHFDLYRDHARMVAGQVVERFNGRLIGRQLAVALDMM